MIKIAGRLAAVFLFLIIPFYSFSQEYAQTTLLGYTESASIHEIDDHGNAYVSATHSYKPWSSFLFPNGETDGPKVFSKLSPEGKLLWSIPFNHTIYRVKADAQENVYVSGVGNVRLSNGEALPGGSFVVKINKSGEILWGVVNEAGGSGVTAGPIALAKDGIYWSALFYELANLQGRKLTAAVPGRPDAFVAKISSSGNITALYHSNSSSIIQEMVEAENGNAAFLISRGGIPKFKIVLNEQCQVLSEKPFLLYGDFPGMINKTSAGYEMLTHDGTYTSSGYTEKGFFHVRFDKNMDLIDSVKLFDAYDPTNFNGVPFINYATGSSETGFFIESMPKPYLTNHRLDWVYMDPDHNMSVIDDENFPDAIGDDVFSRHYVKMVGDTLHMMVTRHSYYYGNTFLFNKQTYTTPETDDYSWFWAKYVYKEPGDCKTIRVQAVEPGKEGSGPAKLRFSLPDSCLAEEDVPITVSLASGVNQNDIEIPAAVTIRKGESFADLLIPVRDDNVMEEPETFSLSFSLQAGTNYKLSKQSGKIVTEDDDARPLTINFPTDITEGTAAAVTISIPDGKVLAAPLTLALTRDTQEFAADSLLDFVLQPLVLPAYTNSTQVALSALNDDLLEGDEFIEGELTMNSNSFTSLPESQKSVKVKVADPDNTFENRVFYITPAVDTIREGNSQTYQYSLQAPLRLQRPITISAIPLNPIPEFVRHSHSATDYLPSGNEFVVDHLENLGAATPTSIVFNWSAYDFHTGDYRFNWKSEDSGRMEIFLPDKDFQSLGAPNTFTPNDDGVNDTWVIKSLEGIRCFIRVYNRYGSLIYQAANYTQPWDGKHNGTNLPEGSYYYQIKVADKTFSGSISIIR